MDEQFRWCAFFARYQNDFPFPIADRDIALFVFEINALLEIGGRIGCPLQEVRHEYPPPTRIFEVFRRGGTERRFARHPRPCGERPVCCFGDDFDRGATVYYFSDRTIELSRCPLRLRRIYAQNTEAA